MIPIPFFQFSSFFKHVLWILLYFLLNMGEAYASDLPLLQSDSLDTAKLTALGSASSQNPFVLEKTFQTNQELLLKLRQAIIDLQRRPNLEFLEADFPLITQVLDKIQESFYTHSQVLNFQYLNELDNLTLWYQSRLMRWQAEVQKQVNQYLQIAEELAPYEEVVRQKMEFADTLNITSLDRQMEVVNSRVYTIDSLLRLRRTEGLEALGTLSNAIFTLNDLREEIKDRQNLFRNKLFQKDSPPVWKTQAEIYTRDFTEIVEDSLMLNRVILKSYLKRHLINLALLLILLLALYRWFSQMLRKVDREKEFSVIILKRARYLSISPFFCALLSVSTLGPYFFAYPPNGLILLFLLLMAFSTSLLIQNVVSKKVFWIWVFMMLNLLVYGFSNSLSELALQEKSYLILFSFASVVIGVWTFRLIRENEEHFPKYLYWLVSLFVFFQGFAVVAHVMGRFSLGKLLGVTATLNLMQAISLYVFVLVVMEVIYLASELGKKNDSTYTSYLDYVKIYKKLKQLLITLAVIMWAYYLITNLHVDQLVWDVVSSFLNETRSLGNNTFTYGSVLIFFVVLWVSALLAKNIAYFASLRDAQKEGERDKKIGSSILLIRLGILSLGFLLAISLSGISLDRVAIVIGALTVGIGFGLQNIVNNLASGIILAFERPVQVGDTIELGSRLGTVKNIGIRSSTIQAYDGSEVIIPNGDLISQQLVNWTFSNTQRRLEVFVGVAYGSDIKKVNEILTEVTNDDQILKHPPPKVLLNDFADSRVEFRMLIWVENFSIGLDVKDKILKRIYGAFDENGIKIPFPQRDLHLVEGWDKLSGQGQSKPNDPKNKKP